MTKSEGQHLLCNGVPDNRSLANRTRELFPDLAKKDVVPLAGDYPTEAGTYTLDASEAERELGTHCESSPKVRRGGRGRKGAVRGRGG